MIKYKVRMSNHMIKETTNNNDVCAPSYYDNAYQMQHSTVKQVLFCHSMSIELYFSFRRSVRVCGNAVPKGRTKTKVNLNKLSFISVCTKFSCFFFIYFIRFTLFYMEFF